MILGDSRRKDQVLQQEIWISKFSQVQSWGSGYFLGWDLNSTSDICEVNRVAVSICDRFRPHVSGR